MGPSQGSGSNPDQDRLDRLRAAETLAELTDLTEADSEHDAYFAAKAEWRDLMESTLADRPVGDGIPGSVVRIDGRDFHVHGITHAGTPEEGEFLRERVSRLVESGAAVYCEQGIRGMYFSEFPDVYEMDDYRWAMREGRRRDLDARTGGLPDGFGGLAERIDSLSAQFREAAFSLIDAGGDVYGDRFETALGDVASAFLTSHEDAATGRDFESFRLTREAAKNPEKLIDLQRYYEAAFLPQPLEREWLRRHDPQLELVTHARNARMADYAVYHAEATEEVHLIVGAAHGPGVRYYLEAHRDGGRSVEEFELA